MNIFQKIAAFVFIVVFAVIEAAGQLGGMTTNKLIQTEGGPTMFDPLVPIITFLVTAGVKEFFDKVLGKPIPAEASAIIAAFVAALILFSNQVGALLPAGWLSVVGQLVALAVMIASAFGIHATIKMVKA